MRHGGHDCQLHCLLHGRGIVQPRLVRHHLDGHLQAAKQPVVDAAKAALAQLVQDAEGGQVLVPAGRCGRGGGGTECRAQGVGRRARVDVGVNVRALVNWWVAVGKVRVVAKPLGTGTSKTQLPAPGQRPWAPV